MEMPDFWSNAEQAQKQTKECKALKDDVETCQKLEIQYTDIETLLEIGYEENDPEMIAEIRMELDDFIQTLESIRMKTLLSGEYDKNNAILKLNAGAGGTESCDWAAMLYRMYTIWAGRKGL